MSEIRFCPDCGAQIIANDRFCGECGFDITSSMKQPVPNQPPVTPVAGPANTIQNQTASYQSPTTQTAPTATPYQAPVKAAAGNKNALIILVAILALVFLGGGAFYWWLAKGEDDPRLASTPSTEQTGVQTTPAVQQPAASATANIDLSQASAYLPEPGLKLIYFVNYPDGTSGQVEHYTARVVSNEAVRVSDVDIINENGEEFGYSTHYVERPDGIYLVYDSTPMEIEPLLKNNLITGMNWRYDTEYGSVVWTVFDMGVSLDLGFTKLENCLLLEEDNQAVGFKKIIYFAPGVGRVLERSPGGEDLLTTTALSRIDQAQAAQMVKKWSPNYETIKDDRTQR